MAIAARSMATTARAACTSASTSTSAPSKGLRNFREFLERAADVVLSFGGSLSGEHGDGQARAALLPKMFGPELMQAFREFKALWDPDNRMNPGKLIDAVRVYDPVENLRHHWAHLPVMPMAHWQDADSQQCHSRTARDPLRLCRTTAVLRRTPPSAASASALAATHGGVMCPSYRATGEEQHSTRGRARLLWEMLAGALRRRRLPEQAVHEALDLCLSCKACKTECPVQVDMAAYKSEFLAQHYKGRLHPLHHYIFGFADKLARWGSRYACAHQRDPHRPNHQPTHQAHRRHRSATRIAKTRPAFFAQQADADPAPNHRTSRQVVSAGRHRKSRR